MTKAHGKMYLLGLLLLLSVILIAYVAVFSEKDSPAVFSGENRTQRNLIVEVLQELGSRKRESFCTFEYVDDSTVWFQVSGRDLSTGNLPWPIAGDPIVELAKLHAPAPNGLKLTHDDTHEERRVITFDCEPTTPAAWADFINAVFQTVHALPDDGRLRGWVTRAD